jgi:hypothetical protein
MKLVLRLGLPGGLLLSRFVCTYVSCLLVLLVSVTLLIFSEDCKFMKFLIAQLLRGDEVCLVEWPASMW